MFFFVEIRIFFEASEHFAPPPVAEPLLRRSLLGLKASSLRCGVFSPCFGASSLRVKKHFGNYDAKTSKIRRWRRSAAGSPSPVRSLRLLTIHAVHATKIFASSPKGIGALRKRVCPGAKTLFLHRIAWFVLIKRRSSVGETLFLRLAAWTAWKRLRAAAKRRLGAKRGDEAKRKLQAWKRTPTVQGVARPRRLGASKQRQAMRRLCDK